MKMAVMGGGERAGVIDAPDPVVDDNYAKVKVYSAPLCTEFTGLDREQRDGFGHEAAGEVVEVGPNVRSVAVGDHVVVMPQDSCGHCDVCASGEHIYCRSERNALEVCDSETGRMTTAQYVIQQDRLLVRVPNEMPFDHAAMACCGFGPAFNAMQSMEVGLGDTVLVAGLGPVGLGAVTVALSRGAKVFGLDVNPFRRNLAEDIGASRTFDPRDPDTLEQILSGTRNQAGVSASVQCTRVDGVGKFIVEATRRRGRISFIAQGGTLDIRPLVIKGLRLYGCWHWNHDLYGERMIATIEASTERINKMITHTFPIDRIADAFDVQLTGECGKVIIHPWDN
jgi:threonine dehydrogenase-like Zn-dependent dehydrogenase